MSDALQLPAGFRIGGMSGVLPPGFSNPTSSSSSSSAVVVSAPVSTNAMQDAHGMEEDKADSLTMKKLSAAKRSAILNQLDDCTDCNNKAKRECPHKRCKTCCARYIAMAAKSCDAHAMSRDESLVGRHLMGMVDGSFENGHFITCVIEDMTYKGIIFTNTCAVKVWRVPKPPDLHVPSSTLTVSNEQAQVLSPLGPAGASSSSQSQPAALASFVTTNPVVGMVPAASLGNNGKRKYVKSGRYAKRSKSSADPNAPYGAPNTPSAQAAGANEMYDRPMYDDDEDVMEDELRHAMPEKLARQMAAYRRGFGASTPSGKKSSKVRKGPRRPQTNYTFFVAEQRPIYMNQNPDASFKDIAGIVAQKWRSLTDEEKKPYNDKAAKDRVRFEQEKLMMERNKDQMGLARAPGPPGSEVPSDVVIIDNRAFRQPISSAPSGDAHHTQ